MSIPAVKETKLKNGLTVAVVEKKSVPIVTVQLLIKGAGASSEGIEKAGLANMTADMLTKGTKTRTAEQIAEQMEFLGGSINSGAGWSGSSVTISVTSDKLEQAMAIMADVVLNPAFKQEEIDLLKSQTLDELKYNLTQPGFLANYVASVYSFKEHPAGGTPASIAAVDRNGISDFFNLKYRPDASVIIFSGDVTAAKANALSRSLLGKWLAPKRDDRYTLAAGVGSTSGEPPIFRRVLVLDLPESGQAAVNFVKPVEGLGRRGDTYYTASVLNSLLGGGYSSRLNQEIRIKRGLSYGAGSNFTWRGWKTNFGARAQTKNESAAEVAQLIVAEIRRLTESAPSDEDLGPRKSVLVGGFGRNLETTQGLVGGLSDLYSFNLPTTDLNSYTTKVLAVQNDDVRAFASKSLREGDIIIVGDYAKFKDDLAKRFPNTTVEVIKADELDITKPNLRK